MLQVGDALFWLTASRPPTVVIAGGGFGALALDTKLRGKRYDINGQVVRAWCISKPIAADRRTVTYLLARQPCKHHGSFNHQPTRETSHTSDQPTPGHSIT